MNGEIASHQLLTSSTAGTPSTGSHVHERLRELILSGELEAGAPISEASLSVRLNVSRTPLREAIRTLASEGLVETQPHRQTRVAAVSAADLEDLYVVRVTLESLGATLTVPDLTEDELATLRSCLLEMDELYGRGEVALWELPHNRFHRLLISRGGDRLQATAATLSDHSGRYRRIFVRSWGSAASDHEAILAACEVRDAGQAARRLAQHLSATALTILANTSPEYDPKRLRAALQAAIR